MKENLSQFILKLDTIELTYLTLMVNYRHTGVTASRYNNYSLNDLKIDAFNYMKKKFEMNKSSFEVIWSKFHDLAIQSEVNIFEDLSYHAGETIFEMKRVQIEAEIQNRIKLFKTLDKKALLLFIDKFYFEDSLLQIFDLDEEMERFQKTYHLIFNDNLDKSLNDILIFSGLLFESSWITSNKENPKNKGIHYDLPSYIANLIPIIRNELKKIKYPKFSKYLKEFKKRFNYQKDYNFVFQIIALDYLLQYSNKADYFLDFIKINGSTSVMNHSYLIEKNILNPFLIQEYEEMIEDAGEFIFTKYQWLEKTINNLSRFTFPLSKTNYLKEFSVELKGIQYNVYIQTWFNGEISLKENAVIIYLYHPNIGTAYQTLFDPEKMVGIISFGEDRSSYIIGNKDFIDSFGVLFLEIEKKGFQLNQKQIIDNQFTRNILPIEQFEKIKTDKFEQILEKFEAIAERLDDLEELIQLKLKSKSKRFIELIKKLKDKTLSREEKRELWGLLGKGVAHIVGLII